MDAVTAAAGEMVRESCAGLRAAIEGLDAEALAWKPAPEANSLAVLVQHATSSTRAMLGSAATGRMDVKRYRDEERAPAFQDRRATVADLSALLDGLESDAARLLAETPPDQLGEPIIFEGPIALDSATRASRLLHAVGHLQEHVGHAQLTRQLLAEGR